MKVLVLVVIAILVVVLFSSKVFAQASSSAAAPVAGGQSVYAFTMKNIDGEDVPLAKYKGKALLIVNTASKCGYTPQYAGLEQLYEQYKSRGFEVLAFPANNFMSQEPGSDQEIKSFCLLKYKTTFPVFAKSSVKGGDINPLYQYLTTQAGFSGPIKWNFNKFLVDPDGKVVARFDSGVEPMSAELVAQVEKVLP